MVTWGDGRLPKRFWDKVQPEPNSGCWLWRAGLHNAGYANFSWKGRPRLGHRVCFETLVVKVPDDLQLDHLCRTRPCVNPEHLEPVTKLENWLRSPLALKGATYCWEYHRSKEACPQGHLYTGENLYLRPDGRGRECRACRAEVIRDRNRRRRGK